MDTVEGLQTDSKCILTLFLEKMKLHAYVFIGKSNNR